MGACIGKKSSKYRLNHKEPQSNIIETSQQKVQDDIVENKNKSSSPSSSKKFSITNDVVIDNNNDDMRISTIDENGISPDLQVIINEQNIINETLSQPFPGRVVSVTDTELEFELANLMLQPQVNDFVADTPTTTNDSKNVS